MYRVVFILNFLREKGEVSMNKGIVGKVSIIEMMCFIIIRIMCLNKGK